MYLQDNCGALNCMQDRMKVMQEVDGGGTDNEDRKVQCLNPQFSQGEKIYHQNGNYPTLRSGSDTGGRGYPNAYVMQEQDVWTSSRAGFWLDFTKNVTNSLVAGGYKGQDIVAVAEKEQDEHID